MDSGNRHSEKVLSALDAAYFAGFVDGEGTLTIVRSRVPERRTGWRYQPCFSIANSDLSSLQCLQADCGNGFIRSNFHRRTAQHRAVYQLRFSPHQARWVLPQIQPYLRLKKRQAAMLLEYLDASSGNSGRERPESYWRQIEDLRVRIQNLNTRGDEAIQTAEDLVIRASRQGVNQWSKPSGSA